MENKGLTNIAASYLYWNDDTPLSGRYGTFGIIAHELAHEWFGNLVTAQWWDDIWLNEGFATFMGSIAWRAEFGVVRSQLSDYAGIRRWYMEVERGAFAHPVVHDAWTSTEELFDAISYTKGRKVLEMMALMLGEDVLLEGIRLYLTTHAGSNAVTGQFFAAIETASGRDLSAFSAAWTRRAGFPELRVDTSWSDADGRFALDMTQRSSLGDDTAWVFPLRIGLEGEGFAVEETVVVDAVEAHFEFPLPAAPTVVSVNRGGHAIVDLEMVGWDEADWAAQVTADGSALGRGQALFEMLELVGTAWRDTERVGEEPAALSEPVRSALRSALTDAEPAVRLFALGRLTDEEYSHTIVRALCAAMREELLAEVGGPDPGDDMIAVDIRKAALGALARLEDPATWDTLRAAATEGRVDYVGPAVGALLTSGAPDRFDVLTVAVERFVHDSRMVRSLIGALASTDDPAIFVELRRFMADPRIVAPLDHKMPRTILGGLIEGNADLAYSEDGMRLIADILHGEVDRPGTIMRTLRMFQDAAERDAEERVRLSAMLTALREVTVGVDDEAGIHAAIDRILDDLGAE